MLKRITSTAFTAAVALFAAAAAVWLAIPGHTSHFGGMLLTVGAIAAAILFGFRLAEGFGPDQLSIWSGPLRSVRREPLKSHLVLPEAG